MKTKLDSFLKSGDLYEVLGWIGVLFVLGGYFLLANGVIRGNAWEYHVLMLFGSAFLCAISYRKQNYQPVVLNALFVLFALIALVRLAGS